MDSFNLVIHERATEEELKSIIAGTEASNTNMRKVIAQNEQIRDMAKLRLIALELAEDRE